MLIGLLWRMQSFACIFMNLIPKLVWFSPLLNTYNREAGSACEVVLGDLFVLYNTKLICVCDLCPVCVVCVSMFWAQRVIKMEEPSGTNSKSGKNGRVPAASWFRTLQRDMQHAKFLGMDTTTSCSVCVEAYKNIQCHNEITQ